VRMPIARPVVTWLKAALSSKGATGDHLTAPRHGRRNRGPLIAVPVRADRRRLRGADAKVSVFLGL
jgi:hypothetical protein